MTEYTNFYRGKNLGILAPILLLLVIIFIITTRDISLHTCVAFSPAELIEQLNPHPLVTLWQQIFGTGIVYSRWLSILIMPLCFAITYHISRDLYGREYSLWSILLTGAICSSLAFMGWTVSDSLAFLLLSTSALLLWRITRRNQHILVTIVYGLAILSLYYWGITVLTLIMLAHGIYAYFFAQRKRSGLSKILLGYGIILPILFGFLSLFDNARPTTPIPWYDFYSTFRPQLPVITVLIYAAALISMWAWYRDHATLKITNTLIVPICSLIPMLVFMFNRSWITLTLGWFTGFCGIGLSLSFAHYPKRAKVVLAAIFLVFVLIPRSIPESDAIQSAILAQFKSDPPLVLYTSFNYDVFKKGADILNQSCTVKPKSIYYGIGESTLVQVDNTALVSKVSTASLNSLDRFVVISDEDDIQLDLERKYWTMLSRIGNFYFYYFWLSDEQS